MNHPFIVKMEYAFQDSKHLYMVFEFMEGGELFQHLQNVRKFDINRTREYAAMIVLALEHIHSKAIIFRDLKPENVLMDR